MENKQAFINFISENYDIVTQMLMFKDKSIDNPIFNFLLKNIILTKQKYLNNKFDFINHVNGDFYNDILFKCNNLILASEVYIKNDKSIDLFNSSLQEFVKLHQDWIILKKEL